MKASHLLVLAVIFVSMNTFAQNQEIILWPTKVPDQIKGQTQAKVSSNNRGDVLRLSEVTKPLLQLFVPNPDDALGRAVIVCPGGGYNILAFDKEGTEVAEWLASLGFHAYVLQYRVPGNRLGAFQDVQRAIRVVKASSQSFGFSKWGVGVMGFSAGGHLSARALTAYDEKSYESIDKSDELSCRPDFVALIYPAYLDDAPERKLSNDLKMHEDLPPCFIFATADDGFGNDAIVFAQELRDSGNNIEFHLLPKGGHGYGLRKGNKAAEAWPVLLKSWLAQIDKD